MKPISDDRQPVNRQQVNRQQVNRQLVNRQPMIRKPVIRSTMESMLLLFLSRLETSKREVSSVQRNLAGSAAVS